MSRPLRKRQAPPPKTAPWSVSAPVAQLRKPAPSVTLDELRDVVEQARVPVRAILTAAVKAGIAAGHDATSIATALSLTSKELAAVAAEQIQWEAVAGRGELLQQLPASADAVFTAAKEYESRHFS